MREGCSSDHCIELITGCCKILLSGKVYHLWSIYISIYRFSFNSTHLRLQGYLWFFLQHSFTFIF